MKRIFIIFIICGIFLGVSGSAANAATVSERTSGWILLDVEHNGEAWYVYPPTLQRYYLGRPADAFAIMQYLSLGITDENINRIPVEGTEGGDQALRDRLAGYILLRVEHDGEAWYVHPLTKQRTYLGRPADALAIMSRFGLGITSADLSTIGVGGELNAPLIDPARHLSYTLSFDRGSFALEVVQLSRSSYRMITDTGNAADCHGNCPAQSLAAYAEENGALEGIHGTYFCPPDYASCAGKSYSYLPPFFNTALGSMLNADALSYHAGPMIIQTDDGALDYFHRTIDLGWSISDYESRTGKTITAAASNYPSLVEGGTVVVESEPLVSNMQVKATRAGIGYNNTTVFLVVAHSASIADLAYIFQQLGVKYAMNLDGGGSSAMLYKGSYVVGPGRILPNAILFAPK